jgi:hypothetical protein
VAPYKRSIDAAMSSPPRTAALAVMALAALDVALFADVLLAPGGKVPVGGDIEIHGPLFAFAAAQVRSGHLPLWNPHLFSGMPALGDPNAMMLYPANLMNLVLPMPTAVTLWTVFHLMVAGAVTYVWTIRQGLHPLGCLLAAAMVCLGAPFFGRIEPGHMSTLAAMTWAPLLLAAVDAMRVRWSAGWAALGAVSVGLQVLGGHPQYLFYSLLAAFAYPLLGPARGRGRALGGLAVMIVGGVCLAAAQLVPLGAAMREAARGQALGLRFASQFSMPWANLVTLFAPGFFGNLDGTPFWGEWLFWEVTPFVGVVGLVMAAYGALHGDATRRRVAGTLAAGFLVLALGSNTPLFRLLYEHVPPFDRFRASGRALFPFSLFTAMLAAVGMDEMVRVRRRRSLFVAALFSLAGLLALGAALVWRSAAAGPVETARRDFEEAMRLSPELRERRIVELAAGDPVRAERLRRAAPAHDATVAAHSLADRQRTLDEYGRLYVEALYVNRWQEFRGWIVRTRRFGIPLEVWADPVAGRHPARAAALGLLAAAATSALAAVLAWASHATPRAALALGVLGVAELAAFASASRRSFDFADKRLDALAAFYRERPGDYRVHPMTLAQSALAVGARDIWGYDRLVPARYARYIAFTQGTSYAGPGGGDVQLLGAISAVHPSYRMLRLQYVLGENGDRVEVFAGPDKLPRPLPRLSLLREYVVRRTEADVLTAVGSTAWDPTRTLILESEPRPAPVMVAVGGTVTLRDESTDHLTIAADLPAPAILLVTDAYSRGWRVRGLEASDQETYEVMPADAVLRAVPLAAGRHLIRMEYVPDGYRVGVVVSCLSLGVLGVVAVRAGSGSRRVS